jgi:hypothetical protein
MPEYNFSPLYDQYPHIIAKMPEVFTSHQFILELAHQNQVNYIEALYAYRNHLRDRRPAPFLVVHGILAQHLATFPHLITQTRKDAPSKHIFGYDETCAEWQKI